jgi:hypothetical protein
MRLSLRLFLKGKKMRRYNIATALLGLFVSSTVIAMDANGVFEKASPSIYVVVSKDTTGRVIAQGSAVAIGRNIVVTNCHVIKEAKSIVLLQGDKQSNAKRRNTDVERDLCTLLVNQTASKPVTVSASTQLERGQTVYAIGAPLGLELTISDGIVSGLRKATGGFIIQTTAAISPGSSGGGLFDDNGRLVGLTTYQMIKGQNLNFAVPAEWIQQIGPRESLEQTIRARRKAYSESISGIWGSDKPEDKDRIIKLSQQHLEADPHHIQALSHLGLTLYAKNKLDSIPILTRLIEEPANSIVDLHDIGMGALALSIVYRNSGKYELAKHTASTAALYIPIKSTLGNYWGYLETKEDYREAIQIFRLATEQFPKSHEAWAYLAGSYMNIDDTENALIGYRKATQLKPDYEWAWLGYIITLRTAERDEELKQVVDYLHNNQRVILDNILKTFGK